MSSRLAGSVLSVLATVCIAVSSATAQSFRVQCPTDTITHPASLTNVNKEPAYTGPTTFALSTVHTQQYQLPTAGVNGAIKCQQISGGDGYSTMADGTQTYMFSFGPLSGLADISFRTYSMACLLTLPTAYLRARWCLGIPPQQTL
jgi:hypothetical protein